jgi:hypothetical protein
MEFEIVGEDGTAGTSIPSSGSMSILFVSRFLGMAVSHRGSAASGPGREHQQSPPGGRGRRVASLYSRSWLGYVRCFIARVGLGMRS